MKTTAVHPGQEPIPQTPPGGEVIPAAAPGVQPSDEEARARIAEAAYYLAERRGFAPGGEVEDWLAAEAQITTGLGSAGKPN
ncbi:MAG: DUF2934 domain-containing protein [Betaproteobacteria bacterium]